MMYAKRDVEETDTQEYTQELKEKRLKELMESYNKELKPDEVKTFSNLVVKKEDHEKKSMIKSLSKGTLLPNLSKVGSQYQSQKIIKPNLKGINPKATTFLTNLEGSVISVENISKQNFQKEYQEINSQIFNKSELETRFQDKRVLKSQVDGILRSMNSKGQKSLTLLDNTLEGHVHNDIKALSKENDLLAKELNELNYQK
jgi:hypothetical protein